MFFYVPQPHFTTRPESGAAQSCPADGLTLKRLPCILTDKGVLDLEKSWKQAIHVAHYNEEGDM